MNNPNNQSRKLSLEGIKLLIGTGAIAATLSFWSIFSNQDRISSQNKIDQASPAQQTVNDLSGLLPPLPTLVPFEWNGVSVEAAAPTAVTVQDLRSVSAPVVQVNNNAPIVVQSNRSGSGSGSGSPATTRSS
jgi:hypothetical protein